ncbi:kinesin-like protein KLP2 isoform X3 [Anguilla anguilla]|uniref:kinesin-like protein KLP2 isoform X3 n=1 Tax=Anguilla anguilla TaxID=7936 RepID=UPI0015ADB79B|nr:kinesin-like protein KLP2 isoform X3 [Anguilla anguilla]
MFQRRSKRQPVDGKKMKNSRTQKESNVTVAVRVRPLNEAEREKREQSVVFCTDKHNLQVSQGGQDRCFSFDAVLGPDSSQEDVFEACQVKRLVDMATQGYSCTVFAFGQTGSGKTFTITGPHSVFQQGAHGLPSHGLMQRCLSHLLQVCPTGGEVTLQVSYLEIYNEQVRDLLDPRPHCPLTVRGSGTQGFRVENLAPVEFRSLDDFNKLLAEGQRRRHTSSHLLNERSSRGHAILTVYVGSQSVGVEGGGAAQGKLSLVDLAGSERVKVTGCKAELLEEAGNINRSLLTLGKCIAALVDAKGRDRHVPYRESKLTKLLCDSLGGTGRTLMIACVSPTASSLPETLNTLFYSSQARRIRPKPPVNQGRREKLVGTLQREIRLLHRENLLLRQRLSSFQEARRSELEVKHAGSGGSEAMTVEGAGPSRPGSSSYLEACLLQELNQEKDKLQQDKVELPDCQESSGQQRELLPEENTQLLDKLQDLKREQIMIDGVQGKARRISSPLTPPPPRDSIHSRLSSPYCPHRHPPTFLPPIRSPGLPEPCFHCHWRPLLYCICPASYSLQGALPPLPALSSDRAARESTRERMDCHSWEADPGSVRHRRTRAHSECRRYTDGFQVNSTSQQAKALEPRPPRSEGRVAPSAPPLPKQPHPFQLVDSGS